MTRILFVDDEPDVCQIHEDFLEDAIEDCAVTTATSLAQAQVALLTAPPGAPFDCVITDMRMPDAGRTMRDDEGIRVIEAARDALPYCQIVVLTAFGTDEDQVSRIMDAGAFGFCRKGKQFEFAVLEHTVRRALEFGRLQGEVVRLEQEVARLEQEVARLTNG